MDHTRAVIYLKDLDGRYLLVNRRWETVFGMTADQVIGKTLRDIFPQTVAEEFFGNDRQVLDADGPVQFEEQFPHHDGIHTYLSLRFPLRDQSGAPYGVCGISTDISERKRAEDALRVSEERLALAMAGSTDGFWDGQPLPDEPWHSPRTPVWWSPRLKQMLGFTDEEFPDVLESWSSRLHPEDHARVFAALTAHIDRKEPYDVEYRLLTKQGTYLWFRARGQAIWDEQGRVLRMAGSLQCITERKQAEDRLRASEERLRLALAGSDKVFGTRMSGPAPCFGRQGSKRSSACRPGRSPVPTPRISSSSVSKTAARCCRRSNGRSTGARTLRWTTGPSGRTAPSIG